MMTIDAAELTSMRAEIASLLPDTCVISLQTLTGNGMGEYAQAWPASGTVSARIDPMRAGETLIGGAIQPHSHFVVTLPYNATVTHEHRLTIGGVNYEIVSILAGNSWALDKRVEVQPE